MVRETYKTTLLEKKNVSSQFLLLLIFATLKIEISIINGREIYKNLLELLARKECIFTIASLNSYYYYFSYSEK